MPTATAADTLDEFRGRIEIPTNEIDLSPRQRTGTHSGPDRPEAKPPDHDPAEREGQHIDD